MTLALETLAVANARRLREWYRPLRERIISAIERLKAAMWELTIEFQRVSRTLWALVSGITPEGYYWRDGKLRRDHKYFRLRAKARRAARHA